MGDGNIWESVVAAAIVALVCLAYAGTGAGMKCPELVNQLYGRAAVSTAPIVVASGILPV